MKKENGIVNISFQNVNVNSQGLSYEDFLQHFLEIDVIFAS